MCGMYEHSVNWLDWDILSEGYNPVGEWNDDTVYLPGDIVQKSNSSYICGVGHSDVDPKFDYPGCWRIFSRGDDLLDHQSVIGFTNKQPWKFVVVKNKNIKKKIRIAAEEEEKKFYKQRATEEWLKDLNKFGTDWNKPFLENAPALIIVFRQSYDNTRRGKRKNYYVNESVGIACGFLLMALQNAGLVSLAHTPSPMGFLEHILERPKNEKAYLLIPVGFPDENAQVPIINKKPYDRSVEVF